MYGDVRHDLLILIFSIASEISHITNPETIYNKLRFYLLNMIQRGPWQLGLRKSLKKSKEIEIFASQTGDGIDHICAYLP